MIELNKLGVYELKGRKSKLFTKSKFKESLFDEQIKIISGETYREFSPDRSKLAAAIKKGLSQSGIKEGKKVLYLGASHGYTPSYVSDIIGDQGVLFALDFAPVVVRDLVLLAEKRENIIPLLEDAFKPDEYKDKITKVDVVFQDIAQKNQLEIFLKNCDEFLENGGFGLLAIKARSIDVSARPKTVFDNVKRELQKKLLIVDYRELAPFEKDHAFFVVKKK